LTDPAWARYVDLSLRPSAARTSAARWRERPAITNS
jgi:hypothetical protein